MDWEGAQLLKAHIYIFIFLLHQVVCSASPTNAPFSHNIVRMKGTTSGGAEAGCQKSWQTAWIDSFCSTRLSSATQFAPSSVSLQHLSVLIEVMDPILTFHFLLFFSPLFFCFFPSLFPGSCVQNRFPNQFRILGEQLSSASNENKCGVLDMSRETGILQPLAHTPGPRPTVKKQYERASKCKSDGRFVFEECDPECDF